MSCCRGTPEEHLASKLPDIESLINHKLVKDSIGKLILFKSPVEFDVFSRITETKIGSLTLQKFDIRFEYLVHWKPVSGEKKLLCVIDVEKTSKTIAFLIADSLSQM
jgi:hypothetical protein